MKKVLLINPPLGLEQRYGFLSAAGGVEIPFGLCTLGASLRKAGFDASIIDCQALNYDDQALLNIVLSEKPDYAGFSATTPQIRRAAALAAKIKTINVSTVIFVGGSHVSALPQKTLEENPSFDIGVVGEGEETLIEAIYHIEKNTDLTQVKGLAVRHEGKVRVTVPRPRIKDLDSLPLPAFDLLPPLQKYYYLPIQNTHSQHGVSLTTSRGCSGECVFCAKPVFGSDITCYSAQYLMELLRVLNKKYHVKEVMFQDDNFFLFKKRLFDFSRLVKDLRLDISWSASARVDAIDRERLNAAKESGCWQVSYGIESANSKILEFYKKGITKEAIEKAIFLTRKAGILAKGFLMFGNPLESAESLKETTEFVKKQPLNDISITFFTPYPGTRIWDKVGSWGTFERDFEKMTCFDIVFIPFGLTKKYLKNIQMKAIREFYFRRSPVESYITRIRSVGYFNRLIRTSWGVLHA